MLLKDIVAERAVLAGLIKFGVDIFVDVTELRFTPDTFTLKSNQIIYECLDYLFKKDQINKIDYASLLSTAQSLGYREFFEKKDELDHLRAVFAFPVEKSTIKPLAQKIKKFDITRQLIEIHKSNIHELNKTTGEEPLPEILSKVEKPIFEFSNSLVQNHNSTITIGNEIDKYIDYLIEHPVKQAGLSSGFAIFDYLNGGGLEDGTITLVASRPGQGKSMFAANVGLFVAGKLNTPTLLLDGEMNLTKCRNRLLAKLSRITINEIKTGQFAQNEQNKQKVFEAKEILKNIPLHYENISGLEFDETLSLIRRWYHRSVGHGNRGLVIYDYLKLMHKNSLENMGEFQALGFYVTSLVNLMIKLNIPCLAFTQLNRNGLTNDDSSALSQSDRMLWVAASCFFWRAKYDDEIANDPTAGNRKLIPIKLREIDDWIEGDHVNYKFEGRYATIHELWDKRKIFQISNSFAVDQTTDIKF